MSRKLVTIVAGAVLAVSTASLALGQQPTTTTTVTQTPTTVTKTVQHPDGTYTVIEYPVGKEVKIALDPITLKQAKGMATILRDDSGTRVVLNLTRCARRCNCSKSLRSGRNRRGYFTWTHPGCKRRGNNYYHDSA